MNIKKETNRILALRDKATKGPWKRRNGVGEFDCFVEGPREPGKAYAAEILGDDYTMFGDDEQRAKDVDFISSAHEMAEHIERMQCEIDRLNGRAIKR